MELFLTIFSVLLILLSVLPFFKNQHWVFRVPEFMKIQILFLQGIVFSATVFFVAKDLWLWIINAIQFGLMVYHLYILIRYTKFFKKKVVHKKSAASATVKVISSNVYQFNKDFAKMHRLIEKHSPDIFITMESNSDWEQANRSLEKVYPFTEKITLENTYGMHLYSKIPFVKSTVHYFVADDVPSIEAQFKTADGHDFVVFAVHPPPPSPTEEKTSKERDGDLLCVAKKIKEHHIPSLVIGDFNTVAWSVTSILFRKTSEPTGRGGGQWMAAFCHPPRTNNQQPIKTRVGSWK